MAATARSAMSEALAGAPSNWGRWGPEDEIGALNFLTAAGVLRGVRAVRSGKVFTLGLTVLRPGGDPAIAIRGQAKKFMSCDKGFFTNGQAQPLPGGLEWSDDVIFMYLQGTTHYDALGHAWYDDQLYNGYDAASTIGGLKKNSIKPIADHGVVGRGVLLDVARYKNVENLGVNEQITLDDLQQTAERQGVVLEKHDILLIRTGWMPVFYREGPEVFFAGGGPGITDEPALIRWFHEMEIPAISSDTIGAEQGTSAVSGVTLPLHGALLRNLGVLFNELVWLEELADDCAADQQYEFLFVGAPLKIVGATGSPVNPTVIK